MEQGDFVILSRGRASVRALIAIISENKRSAMLLFEGAFAGHYSGMPVLLDEGDDVYRSIIDQRAVTITPEEPP
jgi:hypothetical protein